MRSPENSGLWCFTMMHMSFHVPPYHFSLRKKFVAHSPLSRAYNTAMFRRKQKLERSKRLLLFRHFRYACTGMQTQRSIYAAFSAAAGNQLYSFIPCLYTLCSSEPLKSRSQHAGNPLNRGRTLTTRLCKGGSYDASLWRIYPSSQHPWPSLIREFREITELLVQIDVPEFADCLIGHTRIFTQKMSGSVCN